MRSDYDASRLRRTVLKESLGTAAHALLFPFGYLQSRHRRVRSADIETIVFVHGLGANRACFYPLQGFLHVAGHDRQLGFNYRTGGSVEAMALRLRDELDENVKGGTIHIVAHSLGGIVARFYLQALGGDRRVRTLVTLGTPHLGTLPSVYAPSAMLQQLRPDGPFMQHLNALPAPRTRVASFGARNDHLIVPRESALCPFGTGMIFEDIGHSTLLLAPRVFRAVAAELPARS